MQQPVRWKPVFELAERHGTQPLLYQALSGLEPAVPPEEMFVLQQAYQTNLHKSLLLSRELIRIVEALTALGIEVMPYKGLALAEVLYGDIALRQSGDIDLLIRPQDLARIRDAVRELGYTPHFALSEAEERAYLKSGYEYAFDGAAGPNLLEVQWAIQPRFYAVDFDMDGLFQRAVSPHGSRPPDANAFPRRSVSGPLGPRRQARLGTAGLAVRHRAADESSESQLGLDWIASAKLGNRTHPARHHARWRTACLEPRSPPPRSRAFRKIPRPRPWRKRFRLKSSASRRTTQNPLAYFRLMMRLRERPADRRRFLQRLILTPGPGEWNAVHLPQPLFPLYRLVRLSRLRREACAVDSAATAPSPERSPVSAFQSRK